MTARGSQAPWNSAVKDSFSSSDYWGNSPMVDFTDARIEQLKRDIADCDVHDAQLHDALLRAQSQ